MECNELYFYDDLVFTHVIHEIKFIWGRVLLLVDIIWIGVISHNTTNFQGRRNFSFTQSVAGPGEGPALPPPLLFLDQTEARKVENRFLETGPSLSKGGSGWSPPPLSQGLYPALHLSQQVKPSRPKQPRRRFRTSLKLSTLVLTGLPTMFALFLEFGARTLP